MTARNRAPGWSPAFQERLGAVIDELGTLREAAEIAESSHDQLASWRDGKSKMPLVAAVRLCKATGRSVDWLVAMEDGDGDKPRLSDQAILEAAEIVVDAVRSFPRITPREIAEAILSRAYEREEQLSGLTGSRKSDGILNL